MQFVVLDGSATALINITTLGKVTSTIYCDIIKIRQTHTDKLI